MNIEGVYSNLRQLRLKWWNGVRRFENISKSISYLTTSSPSEHILFPLHKFRSYREPFADPVVSINSFGLRVLEACTLAADYGETYDGYIDLFETAIQDYDVNPFKASEDEKVKYLLYPTWKAEEEWLKEWLTYSRNDRLSVLDDLSEAGWRVVRDVLAESTPVDALIHRNTRGTLRKYEQVGLLDTTVPDRNPEQQKLS